MAGSMVLAASTAAGSIDNGVGRRVTIDSDGGRRWRWLGTIEEVVGLREVGVGGWRLVWFVYNTYLSTYGPHSKMCWLYP